MIINFTKDQEMIIIPLLELKEELKGNMTAEKISQIIYSFYKTQIFDNNQNISNDIDHYINNKCNNKLSNNLNNNFKQ